MPEALQLDPIAMFEHDYGKGARLFAYPPVPADELHDGERLALHTFGALLNEIKSPAHIYSAAWRDPSPAGFRGADDPSPPTALLFSGLFGKAAYTTGRSLVETAEMYNRLDRASLRIDCKRADDGTLALDAITLEIVDEAVPNGTLFRSCWKAGELAQLDLTVHFEEPKARRDPFRFHVQGCLPRRYNHGAKIEDTFASFCASGGAMPLPPWVNF